MRLVLDTNVALLALLWRGLLHQLLRAIRERAETIYLFSSRALLGYSPDLPLAFWLKAQRKT